jgi:hypothetical protein
MLRVEIVDPDCGEDEAHIFRLADADMYEVFNSVRVLFPEATSIHFYVDDEE